MSASKKTTVKHIVIGIDPAPSKGLCVYADGPEEHGDNCGFQKHYGTSELEIFAAKINGIAETYPILICWDAPLTTPHINGRFYIRKIEEIWRSAKRKIENDAARDAAAWASVQGFAGCSHWAITQKLLGFPSLGEKSFAEAMLEDPALIPDQHAKPKPGQNGIHIIEVHPALAIQVAVGCETVAKFALGGKLSGDGSYKKVSWKCAENVGFSELLGSVKNSFSIADEAPDFTLKCTKRKGDTDPSDHLDAWVAMQLGKMWLKGNARIYGNKDLGSFLLKPAQNGGDEADIIAEIEALE